MVLVYIFFIKGDGEKTNLTSETSMPAAGTTTTGPATTPVGQDFLTLLLNVKNIKLDDSIFSNPAFVSLHDSTILLVPDGNEGRPNPFAPIGTDTTAAVLPTCELPQVLDIPTQTCVNPSAN
jgi:hypothetical protein